MLPGFVLRRALFVGPLVLACAVTCVGAAAPIEGGHPPSTQLVRPAFTPSPPPPTRGGAVPDIPQNGAGGRFVEIQTPCSTTLTLMHTGPDKQMWFTALYGCRSNIGYIGKIDPVTGYFTAYSAAGSNASPYALEQNAGYMWVGDLHNRQIDRFTAAGQVTAFSVGTYVQSMAAGSDGNLWFSGYSQSIGFMTPSGQSTLYSVASLSVLNSIASGPDGNLWTTDTGGQIVRTTIGSGAMTLYPVGGSPLYIVRGPGVLVYSDGKAAQLSTIDVNGNVTVYPAPSGERPGFLAHAQDGTVYFVDQSDDTSIGTFDPKTGAYGREVRAPKGKLEFMAFGSDGNLWFDDARGIVGVEVLHVLTASPSSLTFQHVGDTLSVAAVEADQRHPFTATSRNPAVASVTQTGKATFSVQGVSAGSTAITIADDIGNSVQVPVVVYP